MKDARGLLLDQIEIRRTQGKPRLAYIALDDPKSSLFPLSCAMRSISSTHATAATAAPAE